MAEKISIYSTNDGYNEADQRKIAVEAALELIRADCLGGMGGGSQAATVLEMHFNNLSKYADQIQEALKVHK